MSNRSGATLRKQFCQINKNILLVLMQQNSFVEPRKHFAISIKFWLLKQNVLSGQQKKFCCIHFFISVGPLKVETFLPVFMLACCCFLYKTLSNPPLWQKIYHIYRPSSLCLASQLMRRKAEERPFYSYSSDDEMDLCNVSTRKRAFKKKTRMRIRYRKVPPTVAEIGVISLPP